MSENQNTTNNEIKNNEPIEQKIGNKQIEKYSGEQTLEVQTNQSELLKLIKKDLGQVTQPEQAKTSDNSNTNK